MTYTPANRAIYKQKVHSRNFDVTILNCNVAGTGNKAQAMTLIMTMTLMMMIMMTHYFSDNLAAPGIEPGTSGSVARNSVH
jgi:hypothetical protein